MSLLVSILIGNAAGFYSEQEALRKWEKNHLPSFSIVQFAMGSRGLIQIRDIALIQKLMRSLPANLDDPGSFWISIDLYWVAYYGASLEQQEVQFYRWGSSPLPKGWLPMGVGWGALEKSIDATDKKNTKSQTGPVHALRRVKSKRIDPRQLVY